MPHQIVFELEPVTPLVSSGPDQRTLEIRPPSVKGALRFWFRAMVGGALGGDVKTLAQRVRAVETDIFGGPSTASPVTIRTSTPRSATQTFHFPRNRTGISYLGYGLSGSNEAPARQYLPPDSSSRFRLYLSVRDRRLVPVVVATVWLLVNFGGLGARTRRGFGGLQFVQGSGFPDEWTERLVPAPSSEKVHEHLVTQGLRQVQAAFARFVGQEGAVPLDDTPPFSVIAPNYWFLQRIGGPGRGSPTWAGWQDALDWGGRKLRESREDRGRGLLTRTTRGGNTFSYYISKDYDEVKKVFTPGQNPNGLSLPMLGLPLQFQFQSVGSTAVVTGELHERRASPLMLRPYRSADGRYCLLVMYFAASLLDGSERLHVRDGDNPQNSVQVAPPGAGAVQDFMRAVGKRTLPLP